MAHYKETCLLKLMKKENRIQRICDYVKNMEKEYYNNDSDKGGIISEGIQFSPILKRTKPDQCPTKMIFFELMHPYNTLNVPQIVKLSYS